VNSIIYAQYSSDAQNEQSIEGQLRECNKYAEKEGITIVNTYIDRAYSAKTDNRPAFQQMIEASKKKLFDTVIVWKLDRFARNRTDSAIYRSILRKNGVKVISAKENISDGPEGIILEAIIEGMSEYYSADLAVKVVRGMTDNALKAKFNGGYCTFGYTIDENKHFRPDPLTAPVVVEVFQKYADGATLKGIVDYLKSKNIRTIKGHEMNYNRVRHIISNRRYLGEYRFRDVVIPDAFEPIVPQSLFDEVKRRIEKNKSGAAKFKAKQLYLLSDKIFCGKCGEKMVGECGRGKAGATYYYYKCADAKHRRCDKKSVRKQYIEDLVIHHTMQMLNDDVLIEQIVDAIFDMQEQKNTMLPLLEKQLAQTEKAIGNMLDAIQNGIFTESTKQRLEELEQSKKDTEIALLQEKIISPKLAKEQIKFWICQWREVDSSNERERKKLIDIFVNAIYHHDNEIVIMFNHKDGEKTITLGAVSASRADRAEAGCSDTVEAGSPFKY
jgi:DNA invertase Pin-like site-specific DNA recombinase